MGNFLAYVIFWGIVAALMWRISRSPNRGLYGCLFSFLLLFLSFSAGSISGILNALGVLIVSLFSARPESSPRQMRWGVALVLIGTGVLSGLLGLSKLREMIALKGQYPFESLSARLESEIQHPSAAPKLSQEVENRLARIEQTESHRHRSPPIALRLLHETTEWDFALTMGFGNARLSLMQWYDMRPIIVPVEDLECLDALQKGSVLPTSAAAIAELVPPTFQNFDLLHTAGHSDFLNPETFGYVRDRDHVAGFQSHRFSKIPTSDLKGEPFQRWKITRLELVSLLRQDTPAVYVSDHLPDLEQLATAPTRPLNSFEETALPKLAGEEDLVIDQNSTRIQMLGSLRAGKNCLECHSVPRGILLGALSYELVPVLWYAAP